MLEAHKIILPKRTELVNPLKQSSALTSMISVYCDISANSSGLNISVQTNVFSLVNGKIEQSRW